MVEGFWREGHRPARRWETSGDSSEESSASDEAVVGSDLESPSDMSEGSSLEEDEEVPPPVRHSRVLAALDEAVNECQEILDNK